MENEQTANANDAHRVDRFMGSPEESIEMSQPARRRGSEMIGESPAGATTVQEYVPERASVLALARAQVARASADAAK
jgi:hypothetical protein